VRLAGMIIRYLGMLGRLLLVAFLMSASGISMRFGRVFVVRGSFVVIVFGHYGS
jgi:hypothetical protein